MPFSIGTPSDDDETGKEYFRGIGRFTDDAPPVTAITSAVREGGTVRVKGSTADTSDIKRVTVNGRAAESVRGSFAAWEVALEATRGQPIDLIAGSEHVGGHVEVRPHKL